MTVDDLELGSALRDLASRVPDDPTRLASVHVRYRHDQRRRRAVGASALVATMAAGIVGAKALASSERAITPAAGGGSVLPACPSTSAGPSPSPATPPAVGQTFTDGGTIVALGPSTITVAEVGGPLSGTVSLSVTPDTKLFLASTQPNVADVPTTIGQLAVGDTAKFTAVRSTTAANTLVELHAGPATGQGAGAGPTKKVPDQAQIAARVGGPFKAEGTVTAYRPAR